jgi:hypothetical protein
VEVEMKISRKIACLMGLLLVVLAGSAQATYGYYDNANGGYYPDNPYNTPYNDSRYDDRYGDRYGDRRLVRCDSRDRRTVYCAVNIRGSVRLVDQHSDRRCVRGRTWGTNSRGIWVTDGCRATFEINARDYDRYGRVIRCESRDSRTVYCGVDSRAGVRLVRQLSSSPCIEGRSWGVARDGIWVSRGCRADFRVGDRDYGYGYYNGY